MLLSKDKIHVKLGGITINSHKRLNTDWQFMLDPSGLVGWYDGTGARRDTTQRLVSNGDFPDKARHASRIISISGLAEASTSSQLSNMRDQFTRILAHGGYELMSVQDAAGIRYAEVGLSGVPSWVRQTDTFATWKIDVYAPSPEIWGVENTVVITDETLLGGLDYPLAYPMSYGTPKNNNDAYVSNKGNYRSFPIFKVTGDFPSGFHIKNNKGSIVTYTGLVSSSSPVTIDMAKGTAVQNGTDRTMLVTRRDWFSIPANSTIRPAFSPIQDGPGWCDIIYRDTWI